MRGFCILKIDLKRAFPKLNPNLLMIAMDAKRIPREISTPLMAEILNQTTNPQWDGERIGEIKYRNGIIEGGPHSMHCLNLCLAYILEPLVSSWKRRGFDFKLKHTNDEFGDAISYPFQNWADDVFLFSDSVSHMQIMLDEFALAIEPMGGMINEDKLEWMGIGKGMNAGILHS